MDAFSAVLDGPRARGAFLLRIVLTPPWGVRVEDEAPLTVITIVSGTACLVDDDGVRLTPRAPATSPSSEVRGPMSSPTPPTPRPQVRVDPEQHCWSLEDGRSLANEMSLGVRTWGNTDVTDARATVSLVGAYDLTSQITPLLVGLLPRTAVIRGRRLDLAGARPAGRRGRARRRRAGRGPRPAPRPRPHRGAPALVHHPRRRRADLVAGRRGRPRRPGDPRTADRPVPRVDGRDPGPARPACPGPRSPVASTSWWARRR